MTDTKGRSIFRWRDGAASLCSLRCRSFRSAAEAQEWPNRPIRFIVPFPAGGSTDVGARVIGEHLSRMLGQQIVVENKSGASGNVGFEAAREERAGRLHRADRARPGGAARRMCSR